MSKVPEVERDKISDALTTKCAAKWYAFLAEEAYFEGDLAVHDEFICLAKALSRSPQGSVYSKKLEEHITKWGKK